MHSSLIPLNALIGGHLIKRLQGIEPEASLNRAEQALPPHRRHFAAAAHKGTACLSQGNRVLPGTGSST